MRLSDIHAVGKNGQPVYGTAAMLRVIFGDDKPVITDEDWAEYDRILHEYGYIPKEDI